LGVIFRRGGWQALAQIASPKSRRNGWPESATDRAQFSLPVISAAHPGTLFREWYHAFDAIHHARRYAITYYGR
jgi:hypothetical protein